MIGYANKPDKVHALAEIQAARPADAAPWVYGRVPQRAVVQLARGSECRPARLKA